MLFDGETLLSEQSQVPCDDRLHLCQRLRTRHPERVGRKSGRGWFQQPLFPQCLQRFLDVNGTTAVVPLAYTGLDLPVAANIYNAWALAARTLAVTALTVSALAGGALTISRALTRPGTLAVA